MGSNMVVIHGGNEYVECHVICVFCIWDKNCIHVLHCNFNSILRIKRDTAKYIRQYIVQFIIHVCFDQMLFPNNSEHAQMVFLQ